ncbi:family 20 glycosylhydrolase [Natronosalvus caseinilyticus]|uniref:family 20 glycosylhydrolase n=1 Tax=Natronosalvus caseinilyticus TaxID=2953747 RepID=UPI0028A94504|nr:family 20 glycosylhydrolase [Natronosalvus caseinilyticus]
MTATELRVVPRPRRVETASGTVRFEPPFALATGADVPPVVVSLFETLLERETNSPVQRGTDDADVELRLEDSPTNAPSDAVGDPEGYVLEADADAERVTIRAASADGLRHGCQTFVTGISRVGEGDGHEQWTLPGCEIHDWPESSWREFMLDPARGFLPVEQVKRRIDQAARAKYNRLHLHLLDDEGYALESAAYPRLNQDADGAPHPAYSPEDVDELVTYASDRGIDIVPEIDVPAHASHLLERYPELRCTVEDGEPADRTICIGSEETVEFVETLLEEVIEQFPFEYVHVGGDEWEMQGYSWNECVDCQAKMAADGSETDTEHFYAFVRHLHDFLAGHDRRTIVWNDQIDISMSPDLPRDLLIHFWRVAAPDRGPVEGCSLERFLEGRFDVINSYVHAAYVRGWITEDYMLGWAPTRRPTVPDDRASQVRGGGLLAWEPSDEAERAYFERALPSAMPIFADRLWNSTGVDDRESYSLSVTRHALGPFVPDGFDVYRELGGLILPTWWKRPSGTLLAHVNRSLRDRTPAQAEADYRSAIETLSRLRETDRTIYPETASAYESSLEWLVEVAERDGRGVLDRP